MDVKKAFTKFKYCIYCTRSSSDTTPVTPCTEGASLPILSLPRALEITKASEADREWSERIHAEAWGQPNVTETGHITGTEN